MVFVTGAMTARSLSTTGGRVWFTGLPFIAKGDATLAVNYTNWLCASNDSSITHYHFAVKEGTYDFNPTYWASKRSWEGDCGLSTTAGYVRFSGTYMTNSPW